MKYIASFLKVANLTCFSGKCQFIIYDKCGADTLIMAIVSFFCTRVEDFM